MEKDFGAICLKCVKESEMDFFFDKEPEKISGFCLSKQKSGDCEAKKAFNEHVGTLNEKQKKDVEGCCRCCWSSEKPVDPLYMGQIIQGKINGNCPLEMKIYSSSIKRDKDCKNLLMKVMDQ